MLFTDVDTTLSRSKRGDTRSNCRNEPSIESTDTFISSWLSGGDMSDIEGTHSVPREKFSFAESFDSYPESPTKRDGTVDMVSPHRFSFTGSPIQEYEINSFVDPSQIDSIKEHAAFARCTSKVRLLSLDDRPHPRFQHDFIGDGTIDKRQLYSHSQGDLKAVTLKIDSVFEEVSPKDICSFPDQNSKLGKKTFCPLPPLEQVTPPMSKQDIAQSPIPSFKRLASPSSHSTPSILRKGKHRSIYEDDRSVSSPFHLLRSDSYETSAESRFNQDFQIENVVGTGSFGTVYKCLSRLDGCMYAVKEAKKIAKGAAELDRMLKEVHALAALSDLTDPATFHIVRYHQAWLEGRRLYIQTELCTSTLSHEIKMQGAITNDTQRRYKLLREMSLALDLIHRKEMVHLDIKPDNIFIKNDQYKLGDFGLVNKASIRGEVDEEGDSRYMARELLGGIQLDLTKCDIFSLGITMYEICSGTELPTHGQLWHDLRNGGVPSLPHTPSELYGMIKDMMTSEPLLRPSASSMLQRRQLLSEEQKQLILEKNKVREANTALKHHQEARNLQSTPKKILMRSHTWNGVR